MNDMLKYIAIVQNESIYYTMTQKCNACNSFIFMSWSVQKAVMTFDEEKPEDQQKLTKESSAGIDSQSQMDQGDTMSCSDSSSKQSRQHHVTGKSLKILMSVLNNLIPTCYLHFPSFRVWLFNALSCLNDTFKYFITDSEENFNFRFLLCVYIIVLTCSSPTRRILS